MYLKCNNILHTGNHSTSQIVRIIAPMQLHSTTALCDVAVHLTTFPCTLTITFPDMENVGILGSRIPF